MKVHYHVHKIPPQEFILRQMNPVHNLTQNFCNTTLNTKIIQKGYFVGKNPGNLSDNTLVDITHTTYRAKYRYAVTFSEAHTIIE